MDSIKTLFNLEFTLNRNANDNRRKKNKTLYFLSYIGTFLFMLLFSFIFMGAFYFMGGGDVKGELSLFITVMQVIVFFNALSGIIKKAFQSKDKVLLSFLPVAKWEIYTAKILMVFLNTFLLSISLNLPMFIMFGIMFGMGVPYYFLAILMTALLPLLPFGLALIVATPMMYIQNWLKNRNIINLILSIIITVVGFYLYSKVIFSIADNIFLKKESSGNLLIDIANVFLSMAFPSTWIANIMMLENMFVSVILFLFTTVLFVALGYIVGAFSYRNIFTNYMIEKNYARHMTTKNRVKNPFAAFFIMEFKELFRSSNYSYTYFGMAVAMPIMVWICNKFIINFAVERIGEAIIFGTTLLVVLVFISMICSPTASFISKEGESFWIIKTNPHGISIPLFAKSLVGVIAASFAMVTTLIVLVAFKFVWLPFALVIFAIAIVYMLGLIALGLIINLLKPNLFSANQENPSNMLLLMVISFTLALLMGILCIFLTFTMGMDVAMLGCLLIAAVFSAITIPVLFATHKKLYRRIES